MLTVFTCGKKQGIVSKINGKLKLEYYENGDYSCYQLVDNVNEAKKKFDQWADKPLIEHYKSEFSRS